MYVGMDFEQSMATVPLWLGATLAEQLQSDLAVSCLWLVNCLYHWHPVILGWGVLQLDTVTAGWNSPHCDVNGVDQDRQAPQTKNNTHRHGNCHYIFGGGGRLLPVDTFTAGQYSPHGMNGVDDETCIHGQDKTSPPKKKHRDGSCHTHRV